MKHLTENRNRLSSFCKTFALGCLSLCLAGCGDPNIDAIEDMLESGHVAAVVEKDPWTRRTDGLYLQIQLRNLVKNGKKEINDPYFDKTVLERAVKIEDTALIKALLGAGANPNLPPALLCEVDSAEVAKLLIDAGADINAEGSDQFGPATPLKHAARRYEQDKALFDLLIENPKIDVNKGSPLSAAADIQCEEAIRRLIQKGADVNAPRKTYFGSKESTSLLSVAIRDNGREFSKDFIAYLIGKGANVNAEEIDSGGKKARPRKLQSNTGTPPR